MDCYEDMFKEITRKLYGEEGMLQTANSGVISGVFNGVINSVHHKMSEYENFDSSKHQDENSLIESYALSTITPTSFETSQEMMSSQPFQDDVAGGDGVDPTAPDQWYMTDESLDWTTSKIASYNPAQKLFRCIDCECCGFLARVAEHWLGTHANLRVFQCPQCAYSSAWARCVRMHLARQHNAPEQNTLWTESPVLGEVTKYLTRLKARVEGTPVEGDMASGSDTAAEESNAGGDVANAGAGNEVTADATAHTTTIVSTPTQTIIVSTPTSAIVVNPAPAIVSPPTPNIATPPTASSEPSTPGSSGKRYNCSVCPYSTDRRDLYTRHEAIHCEEKPFHCYVCQKQFNRADHVKKHFLRMHREQPYDLNRIRRAPPKSASGMSYYTKYNGLPPSELSQSELEEANQELAQAHQRVLEQHQQQQQQQQISMESTQPLHHQQPQQSQQHINIPTMANYQTTMSRMATTENQIQKPTPEEEQVVIIQHQMSAQMTSVITDASKMNSITSEVKPETNMDVVEVPKTKGGREKRYPCPYCSWSGVDNWCLKRHLNTHLKPFVCTLCDYKAARTERLQTHVLKVHNKRTCSRCNFMADDAAQLSLHMQEHHGQLPCDQISSPSPPRQKKGRRVTSWEVPLNTTPGPMYHHQPVPHIINRTPKRWRPRPVGAERLFSYLEASDSEEDMTDEIEIMQCQHCGCDFLDALTMQSHMVTHHHGEPDLPFRCSLCGFCSTSQEEIIAHMQKHSTLEIRCLEPGCQYSTAVQAAMEEHSRLAHPSLPPLNQKCPHCGFVVLNATALMRHQKTHHLTNVVCPSCSRVLERFTRHRNGEMWTDEDDSTHNSLIPEDNEGDKRHHKLHRPRKILGKQNHILRAQIRQRKSQIKKAKLAILKMRQRLQAYAQNHTPPQTDDPSIYSICILNKNKEDMMDERTAMQYLQIKYIKSRAFQRKLACHSCHLSQRAVIPIHTAGSLALHRLWCHGRKTYSCVSCGLRFPHRYQVLLHSSREHTRCSSATSINADIAEPIVTLTVPQVSVQQQQSISEVPPMEGLTHQLPMQIKNNQLQSDQQPLQLQEGQEFTSQELSTHELQQLANAQPLVFSDQAMVHTDEVYTMMDHTRVTVAVPVVPVLYSHEATETITEPQPPEQQEEQQFHTTMYDGMMVQKQVWCPQLSSTYYITQFPST